LLELAHGRCLHQDQLAKLNAKEGQPQNSLVDKVLTHPHYLHQAAGEVETVGLLQQLLVCVDLGALGVGRLGDCEDVV